MQGKYIEPQLTEYLFHKATVERRPICGTFELSPLCNFNCRMCYVHQSEQQLKAQGKALKPVSFWVDLAEQIHKEGVLYLLLTGGEPFLYRDFWTLYEKVADMGFILSINSNGSMLDDGAIEQLKEHPPSRINVTLYGASDETYEKLCGVKQGFTRVDRNIRRLKEAGISVKLNCSLTPYNVADLEKMIRYAEEQELILEIASYMFPPIRLDKNMAGQNARFTPEEMAQYELKTALCQRGQEFVEAYAGNIAAGIHEIPGSDHPCKEQEGGKILCRAGRAIFWVTWEGKITPCGMMPEPGISLENRTFKEVWELLADKTALIRLAPECRECKNQKICHVCAGMTYGENADFSIRPDYLCRYVQALKKECEQYEIDKNK